MISGLGEGFPNRSFRTHDGHAGRWSKIVCRRVKHDAPSKGAGMTPPSRSYRPSLEALESRDLMAGHTANLTSGILRINGSAGADGITVRQINSRLSVDGVRISTTAGSVTSVALSQVSKIEIYGN